MTFPKTISGIKRKIARLTKIYTSGKFHLFPKKKKKEFMLECNLLRMEECIRENPPRLMQINQGIEKNGYSWEEITFRDTKGLPFHMIANQ